MVVQWLQQFHAFAGNIILSKEFFVSLYQQTNYCNVLWLDQFKPIFVTGDGGYHALCGLNLGYRVKGEGN